jgi:hypothetical protein
MARRRRGSDHKLSIPSDAFSRAAIHLETRRVSPTKSRQVPAITKVLANNSGMKGKRERLQGTRNLTSQHLADGLDNTNKKGVAFFEMHDFGHQTRHLIRKYGYLFHKATRFAGLIQTKLRLAFHQG